MPSLGAYPTPVRLLGALSRGRTALWVKHDDRTHALYGGNKVRKVERLLDDAVARGARELVTVGAVGSNHVLTTGVFARARGLRVCAVLIAQPRSEHVLQNLRADLGQGIELIAARSYAHAAVRLAARLARRGSYYVPPGGSNALGAAGFVAAAAELGAQIRAGELPEPDVLVVPLGTGGTTAGLVAGLALEGLRTRVLAVTVAEPPWLVERKARALSLECGPPGLARSLASRLHFDRSYLGDGYGFSTELSARACEVGASVDLVLEHTYTGKAFAAALDLVDRGVDRTVLYWHTLSSAPMAPLLADAPDEAAIDPALRRLAVSLST